MPESPTLDRETRMANWVNDAPPAAPPPAASPTPEPAAPATPAAKAAPEPAAPATPAASPDTAPAASTAVGGPSDWIVAKRGDEEFRIPADAVVEFKRHDQMLTATMDEFRRQGMMATDYKLRKEAADLERQQVQREREADAVARARMAERAKYVEEQERALREAQSDPAKFEQWQGHMEQLRTNPLYRQAFEASLAKREVDAENRVLRERQQEDYLQNATATVEGWMGQLQAKYPGIPMESVRRDYAAQVALYEQQRGEMGRLGDGPLTPQALEQVFQHHAMAYTAATQPVTAKLAALEAELAALKANQQTQHAVTRAAAPRTAPAAGGPAGGTGGRKVIHESETERQERMARWVSE